MDNLTEEYATEPEVKELEKFEPTENEINDEATQAALAFESDGDFESLLGTPDEDFTESFMDGY